MLTTGAFEYYVRDGAASELQVTDSTVGTSAIRWVVVTRSGNDTELIIDGSSVDTNTGSFTLAATPTNELKFGQNPALNDVDFDGKLYQLIMFNKKVTAAEAAEVYNSGDGITYDGLFSAPTNAVKSINGLSNV
jgi:hypothetical protein